MKGLNALGASGRSLLRRFGPHVTPADRILPRTGYTGALTVVLAAAMACLGVLALGLCLAAGRLADTWGAELGKAVTVQIIATGEARSEQTARVLGILADTPGVAGARALTEAEQIALLAPWLGGAWPGIDLPMPQLIDVTPDDPGFDADSLRQRLAESAPDAVLEDHGRWRRPVVEAARALQRLASVAALLIGVALAAMVALAAQAALSAQAQVVRVLRLIGASDGFIARAFVRRFAMRALIGGAAGSVAGTLGLMILPPAPLAGGVLTGPGFQGAAWLWPLLIPPLAAVLAFAATWAVAMRALRQVA